MKVRLTKRAQDQVKAALIHVATNSPSGAARIRARLQIVLTSLESHPLVGHIADRPGVRRLSITPYPYFIDYRVSGDEVVVQRIRHGSRRK